MASGCVQDVFMMFFKDVLGMSQGSQINITS